MTDFSKNSDWSEALIQSLPDGIVVINDGGQIIFFNQIAERITGWTTTAALGKTINEVLPLAAGNGYILDHLQSSATVIPPLNVLARQGQDITVAITTASLNLPESKARQIVLVIRDITAEDAAQHLRSYFLANISHEFRTPLSALKASVELLLEGVREFSLGETLELVNSIHFSVTALQTLIDNLLESVSIEAGRFRIRRRPTDLNEVITGAQILMKPLLERRNQRLIISLPPHLPKVDVDAMRLTQVLVNLLSNASKYSPIDQPIEISLSLQEKNAFKISISDRGPGISSEDKANIFRRFIRRDEKDKAQYGIGLGLSVVKTIVESHGGTVALDERPGGGSIFWFTIPIQEN
jgi:two-component system, OmpR family, phosphate regulon sensor histidine kinase PhoR